MIGPEQVWEALLWASRLCTWRVFNIPDDELKPTVIREGCWRSLQSATVGLS